MHISLDAARAFQYRLTHILIDNDLRHGYGICRAVEYFSTKAGAEYLDAPGSFSNTYGADTYAMVPKLCKAMGLELSDSVTLGPPGVINGKRRKFLDYYSTCAPQHIQHILAAG
jgi:hypothetical protein